MYYQTRLIVLDAISEMKFNLMESSIKIAIFSFFFFFYNNVAKTFSLSSVRHSHSSLFLPLHFFLFFAPRYSKKLAFERRYPPSSVRFRFFRHKSYAKKQIIDIAAVI